MNNQRVILIGDGWGAIAACKSLLNAQFDVWTISNDNEVTALTDKHLCNGIDNLSGEILVFAGYKSIVSTTILKSNICVNIHYSLLPKYRGMHSTVWAILNNELELGLSIHEMNQFIDDGPIIHQYKVKNDNISTSTHYMEMFNNYVEENLGAILTAYLRGDIIPQIQNKSNASWVGRRKYEDCKIDWAQPISYQKAFFRTLVYPYLLPYIVYKGIEYQVTKVNFHPSAITTHIGRILNIDDEGIWVKVVDGYMILKELRTLNGCMVDNNKFIIGTYLN